MIESMRAFHVVTDRIFMIFTTLEPPLSQRCIWKHRSLYCIYSFRVHILEPVMIPLLSDVWSH